MINSRIKRRTSFVVSSTAVFSLFAAVPAKAFADPGMVTGSVKDAKTGEALIEATVKVIACENEPCPLGKSVQTDVDGLFSIELEPNVYQLRAFYELYEGQKLGDVAVASGPPRNVVFSLHPSKDTVDEVVVETRVDKRSNTAMLAERKKAPIAQDVIAAEQIARSPDNNAAEAVKRVVSATVKDGKYVFVRGLGGRYSMTLLNGAELPSPDPDEQAVPLDLFPTSLLANLAINKTYTADVPGTFAGGTLLIESNTYPQQFELRSRLGLDYNSEATFRPVNTYQGGALDGLGFDDGTRRLPAAVPRDRAVLPGRVSDAEANAAGRSFTNRWALSRRTGLPGLNLQLSLGDTTSVFGARLGYLASASFSRQDRQQFATTRAVKLGADRSVLVREELQNRSATESAALSALLNAALELSSNHELGLFSLYTHQADDLTQQVSGESESDGGGIVATRFQFVERATWFNQLRGRHRVTTAFELSWQANFALTSRDEPDTRDLTYALRLSDRVPVFKDQPGSGQRFFSNLADKTFGAALHGKVELDPVTLKFGLWMNGSQRRFDARRFRNQYDGSDPTALALPPDQLFAAERFGNEISFREETLAADAYDGSLLVLAGYGLADWAPLAWLRLQGGLRFEHAQQRLVPGSPFSISGAPPNGTERIDSDPLPALNTTVQLSDEMNLRLAYSSTIARPRFRELAPFLWFDFNRRRSQSGNPALQATRLHNADLRWEWFFARDSLVSASTFFKYFERPIETSIVSVSDGAVSFANARSAQLVGGELEATVSLSLLHESLRELYLHGNAAFVWSRVQIDSARAGALSSTQRALQGQSPVVANVTLGWQHESTGTEIAALYNVYGDRIAEVGFLGLPDVTEKAFHRFDLTASQRLPLNLLLKLSVLNVFDQSIQLVTGPVTVLRYKPGVTAALRIEWQY